MPVIRQLIASAGRAWDVRRGREIILRSGRDVPSLVRMTDGWPGPIAGKWILDNVRTQPRWMSWFSCRHFYVRANWFPGRGHTQLSRAGGVWVSVALGAHSLMLGSKQHGKYLLPSFVKMFQPSNKFPVNLEPVVWHDAPQQNIYRVSAKISENHKRFAGKAKVFL